MPDSGAMLGYGSEFLLVSDSSPDLYVALGEVYNITPPSATLDQIDVTHMQSPDRRREFISGLIDGGECSCEMNFIPGSTTDQRLLELLGLPVGASRRRAARIVYPNHVYWAFNVELTGYEITDPHDDKMTATATFKVTGALSTGTT